MQKLFRFLIKICIKIKILSLRNTIILINIISINLKPNLLQISNKLLIRIKLLRNLISIPIIPYILKYIHKIIIQSYLLTIQTRFTKHILFIHYHILHQVTNRHRTYHCHILYSKWITFQYLLTTINLSHHIKINCPHFQNH
jgi:hypothetical protein